MPMHEMSTVQVSEIRVRFYASGYGYNGYTCDSFFE